VKFLEHAPRILKGDCLPKRTYHPRKRRRAKTHGFRVRMKSKGGRKVLAARRKKGRPKLTPVKKRFWSFRATHGLCGAETLTPCTAPVSADRIPTLLFFFRANDLPQSRFGFSIKKALGGAVVRNRMRRRIREIVSLPPGRNFGGWDFVIHPKSAVAKADFSMVSADLLKLLSSI